MKREPDRTRDSEVGLQKAGFALEGLFNVIQDEIVVLDKDLTVVQHNTSMENVLGRPFIGEKCYEAIRGQSEPCEGCQTLLAFESKTMQSREISMESEKGDVLWKQAISYPVLDQNGEVTGAVEYIQNVTARKKAEEALRESEHKYRILFKNAPVGIGIADGKGNIIDFNDAILRPGGYNRRDAAKIRNASELYDSQEEREAVYRLARKQGFVDNHEVRLKRKDGTVYDAFLSLRPIKIQGRMYWQSIIQDITPLKIAEEALRKAREELEAKVRERTRELQGKNQTLEELNTALKVLLERREGDKKETQEKITLSINQLVKPYLERIKTTRLNETQRAFVDIIESNLYEVFSPFTESFSSKYMRLTPAEIQVANLVKQGKITKEIAEMLNLSIRTIESHRKNIRKKLGITDKKTNLRTHLMSLH